MAAESSALKQFLATILCDLQYFFHYITHFFTSNDVFGMFLEFLCFFFSNFEYLLLKLEENASE